MANQARFDTHLHHVLWWRVHAQMQTMTALYRSPSAFYSTYTCLIFDLLKFAANRDCGNLKIYCPKNDKCLNKSVQCDGKKDCDDWSDEAHCGKRNARAYQLFTHLTCAQFSWVTLNGFSTSSGIIHLCIRVCVNHCRRQDCIEGHDKRSLLWRVTLNTASIVVCLASVVLDNLQYTVVS